MAAHGSSGDAATVWKRCLDVDEAHASTPEAYTRIVARRTSQTARDERLATFVRAALVYDGNARGTAGDVARAQAWRRVFGHLAGERMSMTRDRLSPVAIVTARIESQGRVRRFVVSIALEDARARRRRSPPPALQPFFAAVCHFAPDGAVFRVAWKSWTSPRLHGDSPLALSSDPATALRQARRQLADAEHAAWRFVAHEGRNRQVRVHLDCLAQHLVAWLMRHGWHALPSYPPPRARGFARCVGRRTSASRALLDNAAAAQRLIAGGWRTLGFS